jgi:MFS family permease
MKPFGRSEVLAPLRYRRFLLFWSGQTLSYAGNAVFPVTLALTLAGSGGSATRLGLVLAVMALSEGVFCLVGGVWADRLPRRLLMSVTDTVRCVAQVAAGAAMVAGVAGTGVLVAAGAVLGAGGGVFIPASSGLVPALAGPGQLRRSNALLAVSRRTALLLGPGLATVLTVTVGGGWALILDGATFAASALTLMVLRLPAGAPAAPAGAFLQEAREGWREVRQRPWLYGNFLVHGLWNLARTSYFTVGPMVVMSELGGKTSWGTVVQGSTVGGLCGAVIALRVSPRRPLRVANAGLALGCLPLLLIAGHASVALIAVAAALMSLGLALLGPLWDTVVQQQIPEARLSRVTAFDWVVSTALTPLGMAVAGPLAGVVGSGPVLCGAAALMGLPPLAVLALRQVRDLGPGHPESTGRTGPATQPSQATKPSPTSTSPTSEEIAT